MKARVIIPGNIGKDPEVKKLENGISVVTFSVASNYSYINREGEKVDKTDWHYVRQYSKNVSEKFLDMLKKGKSVVVDGFLTYDEWEKSVEGAKEPIKMRTAIIELDRIQPM